MGCIQDTTLTHEQARWSYPNDSKHEYRKVCRIRGVFHEAMIEDVDGQYHWSVHRYEDENEVCTIRSRTYYAQKVDAGICNDVGEAMYQANECLEKA